MSDAQARQLAAMLTESQRRDMLLLAAVLQAEDSPRQEKTAEK